MLSVRSSESSHGNHVVFVKANAPLSAEQKKKTDRLVDDAKKSVDEAKLVSDRLRRAAQLYRERLTGVVEDQ